MRKQFVPVPAGQLPVPIQLIDRRIYLIRGHKVMLDSDLAELYRVTTGNLNLAVRRNQKRFPEDFMFQLSREESNLCYCKMQEQTPVAVVARHRTVFADHR